MRLDNKARMGVVAFTLRSLGAHAGTQSRNGSKDACFKGINCITMLRDELDLVSEELAYAMNAAIDGEANIINECCSGKAAMFTHQGLHDQLFGEVKND